MKKRLLGLTVALLCMAGSGLMRAQTYDKEKATVTWDFNSATDYDKVTTIDPIDGFSLANVNIGDLEVKGTGTGQATNEQNEQVTFLKLRPSGSTKAVEWTIKPARGLTFTPTKVSAYIQRFGTDAENGVTVTAMLPDGTKEELGNFTAPRNNKSQADDKYGSHSNYTNRFEIELTEAQQQKLTSTEGFTLQATVGVGSTKEGGFSDVRIEGTLSGTIENVEKHTITAKAVPAEGGVITITPEAESYEDGSEIKISANKNFGYEFVNWTDEQGNEISTEPEITLTLTENTNLTANFKQINTYALTCNIEGGGKDYMITYSPQPTVIDGKNMYEEGTSVMLTASSNKIMSFTNWSNGETSASITVDMNEDVELTANYSALDYIVAWDFIKPGSDSRKADFASEDNDAVTLVMRNSAGATSGWLDKSLEAAGGYEGRNAAVNWRTTGLGDYYWQTMVNAEAFTDIKVASAMAYNYNAYTKQDLQYSLDGETWNTVGSFEIEGAKNWQDKEFTLPSEANNQSKLYIRWISDKNSAVAGTTADNDGIALSDIFITGTKKLVDDGTAPALVSTVPEEGNANASANGKIILTFDEKVKIADDAKGYIGITELEPKVSGRTIMFEYKGLEYSTSYTFTLPGGSVSDLTDNAYEEDIAINFSTKTRPTIAKAMYDFIVPDDGTFTEAIAAAEKREDTSKRFRIFIKKGDYVIPASDTETILGSDGVSYPSPITHITTPNVSIIGEDMESTSIVNTLPDVEIDGEYGPVCPIEGLHNNQTIDLGKNATSTYIQDITIKSGMKDARGRNGALEDASDKTVCKNVCLVGYQDTYLSNNDRGRFYFEGGRLRGRTDFLCGKGDVLYNGVELMMCEAGGYICAPSNPRQYGYVFNGCTVKGENPDVDGTYALGRPWGSGTPIALYINTTMEALPKAEGWNEMSGGWPARFAEYNSTTASGTIINLDNRKKTFGDGHENNPVLTAAEAAQLTTEKVMGGDDDWDPTSLTEQASAPKNVVLQGTTLSWETSNYVLCWAVCKDGKVIAFTTEPSYTVDDTKAKYSVRAANEMGGLSKATEAGTADHINSTGKTSESVKTSYYNIGGMKTAMPHNGINIKVDMLEDGTTKTTKILK